MYELQCHYGKSCIGQAGRNIQSREQEHRRDAEWNQVERSAVAQHLKENGQHSIKYDKVKVLYKHTLLLSHYLEITRDPNNFYPEHGYCLSNTRRLTLRETQPNENVSTRIFQNNLFPPLSRTFKDSTSPLQSLNQTKRANQHRPDFY